MKTLKPDVRDRLLALARDGYSNYAIEEATGCARTTIQRHRKLAGIPPHPINRGRGNKRRVPPSVPARTP